MSNTFEDLKQKLQSGDPENVKELVDQIQKAETEGNIDADQKKELTEIAKDKLGSEDIGDFGF